MAAILKLFSVKKKEKSGGGVSAALKAAADGQKKDASSAAAAPAVAAKTEPAPPKPVVEVFVAPGPKEPEYAVPQLVAVAETPEEKKKRKEEKEARRAARKAQKEADKKAREEAAKKKAEEDAKAEEERKKQAIVKQAEMEKVVVQHMQEAKKETADTKMAGLGEFIKKSKKKDKEKKAKKALEEMKPEEKEQAQVQAGTIVEAMKKRQEEKAKEPEAPPAAAAVTPGEADDAAEVDAGAVETSGKKRRDRIRKGTVSTFIIDEKEANKPKFAINILTYGNPNPTYDDLFGEVKRAGLYRWRMDAFDPVLLAKDDVEFHTGDVYVVLSVPDTPEAQHWMAAKEAHTNKIHIWRGAKAPLDKVTSASIRAVQLNTHVHGAKHFSELQGAESDAFKAYYFGSMKMVDDAGSDTGFHHVNAPAHTTRLYHLIPTPLVKGADKKALPTGGLCVRAVELVKGSLNNNFSFLCDAGRELIVWSGAAATPAQEFQGLILAQAIAIYERRGQAVVHVVRTNTPEEALLWKHVAPTGEISTAGAVSADALVEADVLYGTNIDEEGTFSMSAVWQAAESGSTTFASLSKALLKTQNAFILDAGNEVWTWWGAKSTTRERQAAAAVAARLLENKGVTGEAGFAQEKWESLLFRTKFADWLALRRPSGAAPLRSRIAKPLAAPAINVKMLVMPALSSEEETALESTDGTTSIWVQDGNVFEALPDTEKGQLYSGNAYVIMYSYYDAAGKQRYITYYWAGIHASPTAWSRFLNGLYTLLAPKIRFATGAAPTLVRTGQAHEPEHLMALFQGRLIVHTGKRGATPNPTRLYHVRHVSARRAYCVQVPPVAASLHSKDSFILSAPNLLLTWTGKLVPEQKPALGPFYVHMQTAGLSAAATSEGNEPPSFWDALGGKAALVCDSDFANKFQWARLLHASHASGALRVNEVQGFSQASLEASEVFVLDGFHEAHLWLGQHASPPLVRAATGIVEEFAKAAGAARKKELVVSVQHEFAESSAFTRHFFAWTALPARVDARDAGAKRLRQLEKAEYLRRSEEEAIERDAQRQRIRVAHELYAKKQEDARLASEALAKAEAEAAAAKDEASRKAALAKAEAEKAKLVVAMPAPKKGQDADEAAEDLKEQLDALKFSKNTAPPPVEPCAACGQKLESNFAQALGKKWHVQCLVCQSCKAVSGRGYLDGKGMPYCASCHRKLFGDPCAGCGKPLADVNKKLQALDKLWHKECFVCTKCKGDVSKAYIEENGMPYCESCADELFGDPCCVCTKPLGAEHLSALGKKWHIKCFACSECKGAKGSLNDGVIIGPDDRPYCNECDPEKCEVCKKSLGPKRLKVGGKRMHQRCFTCSACKRPDSLIDGYLEEGGEFFCDACYDKKFSKPCAACAKPLDSECVGLGNKSWHIKCFACTTCRTSLISTPFVEKAGRVYCKKCDPGAKKIETLLPPEQVILCAACNKACGPKRMSALDQKWHPECFVCGLCKASVKDGYFPRGPSDNKRPYCLNCKDKVDSTGRPIDSSAPTPAPTPAPSPAPAPATAPTPVAAAPAEQCPACNQALGAKKVGAMGKKWHSECFVCVKCKGSLAAGFFERNGMPWCATCKTANPIAAAPTPVPAPAPTPAATAPAPAPSPAVTPAPAAGAVDMNICPGCNKALGPKRVAALDRKWHPECFVCQKCRSDLEDDYFERRGLPYCEKCIKSIPK